MDIILNIKEAEFNKIVLYNKIDLERFSNAKKIDSLPQPLIISVGRLIEPKNHQCMIHAMQSINANLLIIGDGLSITLLPTTRFKSLTL